MISSDGKFSDSTKALIAMNAGFQCSYPGCSVLTGLPREMLKANYKEQDGFKETLLVGDAAHIVASKKGGPRGGDVPLSDEERKSPENGIWLCANHHRMIDRLRETYGVETIKEWKRQQEELVRTVSAKVIKHEAPETYLDEPALNRMRFNRSVNAKKIIHALECDECYRDQDKSFFDQPTFLDELNQYFAKWATVPYRARKLASVALLRIICNEQQSMRDPMWMEIVGGDTVRCPLMVVHEAVREIDHNTISSDGSWQRMVDTDEFFALINSIIPLNGSKIAWPSDDEQTFIDNDLLIRTVVFKSKLDGFSSINPNVWELIRYVYKEYYATTPERLVDSLIVHGNASILDVDE